MRKKIIKKLWAIALAVSLMFTFVSCKTPSEKPSVGNRPIEEFKDTSTVFIENQQSNYSIVVSENASEAEVYAASELQKYVREATGTTLTITTDAGKTFDKDKKYISVGDTTIFDNSGMTVSYEELNRDGYKIKTFGNTVVINAFQDIGVLYGVYGFLKAQFNWEAYAGDEIYFEKTDKAYIKDLDFVDAPDFEGRETDCRLGYDAYSASVLKMRTGAMSTSNYGGGHKAEWVPNPSESFRTVIDPDIYQEEHPEWFEKTKIQLCLTAEGIVEETAKRGIELLEDNPNATYFNMSQGDGNGYCDCANCAAEIALYNTSGYIIRFMNKVIDIMEKWHEETCPDRLIRYSTFAYAAGMYAPTSRNQETGEITPLDPSVVPHPKLYIRLTSMYVCHTHHIDDPTCPKNVDYYDTWESWNAICDNFTIYHYIANYDYYLSFFNSTGTLQNTLKYLKGLGCVQVGIQNTTGEKNKSMGVLENYLIGKLMWNLEEDVNALIENFMSNYYKEAAPYMMDYFNYMRGYLALADVNRAGGVHQMIYNGAASYLGTDEIWTRPVLEKAQAYIEQAMEAAEEIEDLAIRNKVVRRVLEESVCVRYMIARNYSLYYVMDAPTYLAFVDNFERDAKEIGVNMTAEKQSLSQFITSLREKLN